MHKLEENIYCVSLRFVFKLSHGPIKYSTIKKTSNPIPILTYLIPINTNCERRNKREGCNKCGVFDFNLGILRQFFDCACPKI